MVQGPRWNLGFWRVDVGWLRGRFVADCILGWEEHKGRQLARDRAVVVASGCSNEYVDFVGEFNKQHFDCAQHLHLHIKCGLKTHQASHVVGVITIIVIKQQIGCVWGGH